MDKTFWMTGVSSGIGEALSKLINQKRGKSPEECANAIIKAIEKTGKKYFLVEKRY